MPRNPTSTITDLKKPRTAPAPTATSIRAYGKTLALALDAMKLGAAEAALASARGKPGAKDALANLCWRIKATEFEIELNDQAVALAMAEDAAAEAAWRAAIQEMDPEEIIEGIGKDVCCGRCTVGVFCVITAAAAHAGPVCGHPVKSRHLFQIDQAGRVLFPYRDTPRAREIYAAACRKLRVPTS
jgi:hypothetical protein